MTHGPSYVELGVPDRGRAAAFYGPLLGWPAPQEGTPWEIPGTLDIGVHGDDEDRHFEVFFNVPDLAAALEQVVELGGRVVRDPEDAGPFGSFAECADDQGVRFGLRQLP